MIAGFDRAVLVLLSFDNVRLAGIDGLILAATLAVIALTWRTVRSVPAGELAVSVPGGEVSTSARERRRAATWTKPNRITSFAVLIVGALVVWAGVRLLAQPDAVRMGLFLAIVGLAGIAWLDRYAERAGAERGIPDGDPAAGARTAFLDVVLPRAGGNLRWVLAGVPIFATMLVWRMNRARLLTDDHTDIVVIWLVAIAATLVAIGWPVKRAGSAFREWLRSERGWLALVAVVAILAGVLRLWDAGNYPWTFSGDEGQFALEARRVLNGELRNPFGTGFLSHPNLFFYLQAWSIQLFGEDVAGVRALSGLMGVAAVVAVMFYVRHLFGALEGAIAGIVLAVLHHHVYLSRLALNNIGDALFLVLTLWLVDRGVVGQRRMSSLLAGMAIGAGQYFYFGSRLLPVIAAAVIAANVILRADRSLAAMRSRLAALAPYAVLTVVGAIVVVTPYLAYYADHSFEANGRVNQVSIFASGWLEREAEATGRGEASIVMHRIWDCLLLPFHGFVHGFYRPGAPYVGEDLAIPVAIGIGVAVAGFWRRRYVGILITYAAVAGGLAITEGGLYQSNRYSGVVVLFSLLTAVGLGSVLRVLSRLVGAPAQALLGGLALALGLIGAWNVDFYFRDDNQVELYSDPNTQIANTLAYELLAMEPAPTVYFVGPPQMWYGGFANIEYIVPEAVGITVEEPLTAADQPPELTGTTLYVFLPFRIDEYETVRGWFPGGEFREVLDEAGALLYYEYRVEPGQTGEPSGVYGN